MNTTTVTNLSKQYYTSVNSKAIRDDRLSWKARGLLVYLLSQSKQWTFYVNELVKHSPDGKTSLQTGLKELEKCGYLYRTSKRTADGKFSGPSWVIADDPQIISEYKNQIKLPLTRKTGGRVFRQTDNQSLRSNNNKKYQYKVSSSSGTGLLNQFLIDYKIHLNNFQAKALERYQKQLKDDRIIILALQEAMSWNSNPNVELPFKYFEKIVQRYIHNDLTYADLQQEKRELKSAKKPKNFVNHFHNKLHEELPEWAKSDYQPEFTPPTDEQLKEAEQLMVELRTNRRKRKEKKHG